MIPCIKILFSTGAFSGDDRISYTFVVIFSVPVPDSNTFWYILYTEITIDCEKVGDKSDNGLVSASMSSLSKSNQVHISSFFFGRSSRLTWD